MIMTSMDLAQLQSKLDEYLTPKDVQFIRCSIFRCVYARNVLQAIVMLLGYPYPTTMQIRRVLERKDIIQDIKNLHQKRISDTRRVQIMSWMRCKSETFANNKGMPGYKPLAILKEWAIYIIKHQSELKMQEIKMENKLIQAEMGRNSWSSSIEIYTERGSTKIILKDINELQTEEFSPRESKNPTYSVKAISILLDEHEKECVKRTGRLKTFAKIAEKVRNRKKTGFGAFCKR